MPDFVALWGESAANEATLCALGKGFFARREMSARPGECRQIEELIPSDAIEALRRAANAGEGSLLLLEASLPDTWLELEWESMTISGSELGRSVLVVRRARATFRPPALDINGPARWLNLFPREELDFNSALESVVDSGALRPTSRQGFADDVATAPDLFIVAHANELGLEDQLKRPYALPAASVLPTRVWLLACNKSGAMDILARRLLEQGAGCVVSASGDLSATEMLEAVRNWLGSARSTDLASWILANRSTGTTDGGIGSLRPWGSIRLDASKSSLWNEATWDMEHGVEPRISLNDDTSRADYSAAAEVYDAPETWESTRKWMASRLLWLAERHDHSAMAKFERDMPQAQSAWDYEALSGAARRLGHYPQAGRYLAHGLCLPGLSEAGKAVLLGNLTNVLIDLNLPKSARAAESAFEDCVVEDPQTRGDNDFRRLDFLARIAAREGKIQVALDRMREKQTLALAKGDDSRELAGLLYLTAWAMLSRESEIEVAKTLAVEVLNSISVTTSQQMGKGNETTAYLLRALAAYFWASQDGTMLPHLERWHPFAEESLRLDDPGPWSYMLAFMHLANRMENSVFDRAMESLERARYFLESAMFYSLASRDDDCSRALSRFNQRRLRTLAELPTLQIIRGYDPAAEALARSDTERRSPVNPGEITVMGLVPL